ncbi:unnamed protein product [Adineta steineri]|uniref:Uncharacterized protein n=1 Tax=Adineta steineri TaxID=433720 RepID=A0A819MQR5_9BILA|nr:unnamed protein product [Adineta steineri]
MSKQARQQKCTAKERSKRNPKPYTSNDAFNEQHVVIAKSSISTDCATGSISTELSSILLNENESSIYNQPDKDNGLEDHASQIEDIENTTEEKNDEELFTQTGTQNTYYSESDDSDAHQEQLYELEDVEDDSDSNSSTPILASQTIIPNQSPLYSDDSRTSTNSHLPSDNISKRLSTTQQVLWEKLRNITCIDEFEKQLQSEDEEDDNSIDRRSTRIFNGLLFH